MKFNTIVKLFTALATVVGAIYIVATYGDKIVEWAKGIMNCCCKSAVNIPAASESDFSEKQEEAPVQTEEVSEPAAAETAEEPAAQEVLSEDAIPVANEEDFEG